MGKSSKPKKPHPDFPLYAHASGRWAKRVKGRIHYFGPWADPEGALNRWLDQKDDLLAGRKPRVKREGLTVGRACDYFLHAKKTRVESGELAQLTRDDYRRTCRKLVEVFGRERSGIFGYWCGGTLCLTAAADLSR